MAGQGGGAPGGAPAPQAPGGDLMAQLQALVGGGGYKPNIGAPGAPGQANMGAYLNANKATAGNPMLDAIAMAQPGADRSPQQLSVNNPVRSPVDMGDKARLGGDQDYYDINEANQNVRGNLPKPYQPDYTGFSDEMMPMDEKRQTPDGKGGYGKYNTDTGEKRTDDWI